MNKFYDIFINMTRNCNFRCVYCYEEGKYNHDYLSEKNAQKILEFIKELKNSNFFIKEYSIIRLTFFGGEPLLNKKVLKYIVEETKNDDSIYYSLITNGSKIRDIIEIFDPIKNIKLHNIPKLHIQVSYDGYPINVKTRLDISGKDTSQLVKDGIKKLFEYNYNISIKSTITPDNFKYLPDAYEDIESIYPQGYGTYFPTIDYYNEYPMGYKIEDLNASMVKLAAKEASYFKKYHRFFFSWFENNNNKICSAGKDMIAIDTNLDVYPCHGAFFENSKDHLIGNLHDEDILNKINNHKNNLLIYAPETCQKCNTSICYKCNIIKYKYSKKNTYNERWNDHSNQPWLCNYYTSINKIKLALYKILF